MNRDEWRQHVKREFLKRRRYQFGQPPATCNLATDGTPGDVACGDTTIQMVLRLVKGKDYSINKVRQVSGAPNHVPMPIENARLALRRFGLPYEVRTDLDAGDILRISRNRGPVLIAEDYWAHPQWEGRGDGFAHTASGHRVFVGFADPRHKAGKTQHTFRDGHMVLLGTTDIDGTEGIVRDTNHNSAARPERPAWDKVSRRQIGRMLRSFNHGRNKVVLIPTEVLF